MFGFFKRLKDDVVKSSRSDYENLFIETLVQDLKDNPDKYTAIIGFSNNVEQFIISRDHKILIHSITSLGRPFKAEFTASEKKIVSEIKDTIIKRDTKKVLKDFWK